ncbi:MAG: GerW family sporulation protein [Peptococcaceae bacterium]|nr:GerW family sporulation protein [Peptococcaceae bacterium]
MSSINDAMNLTMQKLREMIDVNTVIGQPITTPDGTTLIPVSKVTFGFASGGTDGNNIRFGAGSGAGVTISPQAFVVISNGNVRMLYVDPPANSTLDKAVDLIPGIVDKFKKDKTEETPVY